MSIGKPSSNLDEIFEELVVEEMVRVIRRLFPDGGEIGNGGTIELLIAHIRGGMSPEARELIEFLKEYPDRISKKAKD